MKCVFYLFLLSLSFSSYSQTIVQPHGPKIKIIFKNDSTNFIVNGLDVYPPYKVKDIDPTWVYVAMKKGYVNEGFTYAGLAKKGINPYTIDLQKIKPLPANYTSKMLEVYKVVDKTGRLMQIDYSDPFFVSTLTNKIVTYGYKNVANTDLFDSKQKEVQLKIVGEITELCKNTIGPGFQICLIVNWSVYDVVENKVVFQCSGAGYSNTEVLLKKEVSLALRNAMTALLSNTEFQQLAKAAE